MARNFSAPRKTRFRRGFQAIHERSGRIRERLRPQNLRAPSLDWLNFLVADVRGGLGPYVVVFLTTDQGWTPTMAGIVSTVGGWLGLATQTPIGAWVTEMSRRLTPKFADDRERRDFLATVYYEATRAGLDPQVVLGVIHHESGFKKYAVSSASARGFMQVMPFWTRQIGSPEHNLFNLRTNLRYGCVILRHYLDMEAGDYFRALGRYNGSLGRAEYPNAVLGAAARYRFDPAPLTLISAGAMPR